MTIEGEVNTGATFLEHEPDNKKYKTTIAFPKDAGESHCNRNS